MATLIDIAIQQILFLANAPDDVIDPDVAVGQLELLSAELVELPTTDLAAVRTRVEERLVEASGSEDVLTELHSMLNEHCRSMIDALLKDASYRRDRRTSSCGLKCVCSSPMPN